MQNKLGHGRRLRVRRIAQHEPPTMPEQDFIGHGAAKLVRVTISAGQRKSAAASRCNANMG